MAFHFVDKPISQITLLMDSLNHFLLQSDMLGQCMNKDVGSIIQFLPLPLQIHCHCHCRYHAIVWRREPIIGVHCHWLKYILISVCWWLPLNHYYVMQCFVVLFFFFFFFNTPACLFASVQSVKWTCRLCLDQWNQIMVAFWTLKTWSKSGKVTIIFHVWLVFCWFYCKMCGYKFWNMHV